MAGPPNARLQGRIEFVIRVAAPLLDLMLAAGEGVSRLIAREDADSTPVRMGRPGEAAPRGLRRRP